VDRELLDNLCGLARLRLDPPEVAAFAEKFGRLLEFVQRTQSYEPLSTGPPHTSSESLVARKDVEVDFTWPRPASHDYRVPRIIDFEGES
jgi:Asp-tRNA(Asn)/Glu-tRNA(Gln) amidotransferase C subunit